MKRAAILLTLTVLTGCSTFPEVDAAMSAGAQSAAYPTLVPMDQLIVDASTTALPQTLPDDLEARADRLRARAARLSRRSVLTHSDRATLKAAIDRHPG